MSRLLAPGCVAAWLAMGCAASSDPVHVADVAVPDPGPAPTPDFGAVPDLLIDPGPCGGVPDGGPCDDGSVCTLNDTCIGGYCVSTETLVCLPPEDGPCVQTSCDRADGCITVPAAEGESCSASCFGDARCLGGQCVPTPDSAVECPPSADPCVAEIACNPETGACDVTVFALACGADSTCRSIGGAPTCVRLHEAACRPCDNDASCASSVPEQVGRCLSHGAEGSFCATGCEPYGCPTGSECTTVDDDALCLPEGGACSCDPAWAGMGLVTSCFVQNAHGTCHGQRGCGPQGLSACDAPEPAVEVCNGVDDDCDGTTDEVEGGCGDPVACCADGACSEMGQNACFAIGGQPTGQGVSCSEIVCAGQAGACCTSGTCEASLFAQCAEDGGVYHGDGVPCGAVNCFDPPPLGACCGAGGACANQTAAECSASGQFFSGPQTSCVTTVCPQLGACCLPDSSCVEATSSQCEGAGGGFLTGAACENVDCLLQSGTGACCTPGSCAVLSEAQCGESSGLFLVNEQCVGQCPAPATGACCSPLGECSIVPSGDPDSNGDPDSSGPCAPDATWQGTGSTCPEACAAPEGACCTSSGCFEFTEPQCAVAGGAWAGTGTSCPANCPP